jgi:hypothetical protein
LSAWFAGVTQNQFEKEETTQSRGVYHDEQQHHHQQHQQHQQHQELQQNSTNAVLPDSSLLQS